MEKKRGSDPADRMELKQKKGIWLRFLKLFAKCRLPWVFLIIYIILSLGLVNIGISTTDYTARLFAGDTSGALLARLIGVTILNLVASNLVVFFREVTSAKINRNMRGIVLEKVMGLPLSFFKDENPRDAIYRIVSNSGMIDSTIMLVLLPLLTAGYKAVSILGRIFRYDWRLSAILVAFIPIQILLAFLFGRINYFLNERDTAVNAGLTQRLAELVTNIPLAKAFGKEEKETAKGEELTARLYKLNIKSSWVDQLRDLSGTAVDLAQSVIIVVVGVALLRDGAVTSRAWIAFFLFSSLFSGAITEFAMYWNNLKTIQGGAQKVAEIMDAPREEQDGEPCQNMRGDLVLRDVCFEYEEGRPVLDGVTCRFPDNTVTALLGVSGCGKTTLINLLTRLYTPRAGSITVNNSSIYGYALDEYRNQFVTVSQNSMLFAGTVWENVCYGNGPVSLEAFWEALRQAGACEFVKKLPKEEQTVLEEYGNNLSGGQRQRLAIARALLSDAHYLVLDEPAASMDAIAAAELMDILKQVSRDRCMIVIAHTAAVLPLAGRVVVLEEGRVTAQGDVEELCETNRFLCEFTGRRVPE